MSPLLDTYRPGRFRGLGPRCPRCGAPTSHGLRGNPANRRTPPCAQPTTTVLPSRRDGPRDAARRAARRARLKLGGA